VLANSEVDRGRFGIAAPVLSKDRRSIGSISFVLDARKADERTVNRLAPMIISAAREVERAMRDSDEVKMETKKPTSDRKRSRGKARRSAH
jgi:DNA-binding IclR family transcriptional regulator